jgi:hypothetical protein
MSEQWNTYYNFSDPWNMLTCHWSLYMQVQIRWSKLIQQRDTKEVDPN